MKKLDRVPNSGENKVWWRPALLTFFQMSGWIGIPVIGGLFLGKWLDDRYGTEPWLFITTVGVAFIISMIGIIKEAFKAMRLIEKDSNNKNKKLICFQHEIGKYKDEYLDKE